MSKLSERVLHEFRLLRHLILCYEAQPSIILAERVIFAMGRTKGAFNEYTTELNIESKKLTKLEKSKTLDRLLSIVDEEDGDLGS